MATAAMIKIIATTINSSISEKPCDFVSRVRRPDLCPLRCIAGLQDFPWGMGLGQPLHAGSACVPDRLGALSMPPAGIQATNLPAKLRPYPADPVTLSRVLGTRCIPLRLRSWAPSVLRAENCQATDK